VAVAETVSRPLQTVELEFDIFGVEITADPSMEPAPEAALPAAGEMSAISVSATASFEFGSVEAEAEDEVEAGDEDGMATVWAASGSDLGSIVFSNRAVDGARSDS
jgi:hypothetical protein